MRGHPERAPRAARDDDRDRAARRDARATGGDSTADRNCPAEATATPPPTPTATPTPSPTSRAAPSATATATPTTFRYDTFDPTGAAASPGSYAFLMPDGHATSVVTTYEQLRTEASVMRVNVEDSHGASWAGFYDGVAVGDIVEWRQADDCWARYQVASAARPARGAANRDFGVRWVTYTYTGCSGSIGVQTSVVARWTPPDIKSPDITAPVYHGHYLLVPETWYHIYDSEHVRFPRPAEFTSVPVSMSTTNIAEARDFPLWHEPALPPDWVFRSAETATLASPGYGFTAYYGNAQVHEAVQVTVGYLVWTPEYLVALKGTEQIRELRVIEGRPTVVKYTPVENRRPGTGLPTQVLIFDQDTRIYYLVEGYDESLRGSNIDAAIAIARSLYRPVAQ